MSNSAKPRNTYFVLFDGVQLLDVSGPAEVLSEANAELSTPFYKLHFVANTRKGVVSSSAGLPLGVEMLPELLPDLHTLVIPGSRIEIIERVVSDPILMAWLAKAVIQAKRVVSICSGAFILGRLGLLDNRQATTHWGGLEQLQKENPRAHIEDDLLFTQSEDLWTSAGVMSGVDMMLALVSHDLDPTLALRIARNIVVFLIREGGQSQFSAPMDMQFKASRGDLTHLITWMEASLDRPMAVEEMAEYMSISVRTLHRRCRECFAMGPAQILMELRHERSRLLLLKPNLAIKNIAINCGYQSAAAFSKAFTKRYNVSPRQYQGRFRISQERKPPAMVN